MSARVLREEPLAKRKILVAIVDVTEAKREGRALKTGKSEVEKLTSVSLDFSRPPAMICANHCKPSACFKGCWKSVSTIKPR
jgi:hypothetical protein